MTRIRYTKSKRSDNVLESNKFIISKSTIIQASIHIKDLTYYIRDQNLSLIAMGKVTSLRQAKVNCRGWLIKLGVKIYDEVRD
jgi:hypothetical protein